MSFYPRKVADSREKLQNAYDTSDPIPEREIGMISVTPAAKSATAVHAAIALGAAAADVTTGITNPDVARNITITGNASGITGNVVITGKNAAGKTIAETLALNGTAEVAGSLAFEQITKISVPIQTHAGTDTVSVGVGEKIGLGYALPMDTILTAAHNGVREANHPTVTIDADEIEKNVFSLAGASDGKRMDLWFIAI